jgi:ribonucleoside-diphosphate reductase alpha chain
MFTNDFSREIWDTTYRTQDEATIEETLRRVAIGLSAPEKKQEEWEEKFYDLLCDFKFVPGGRILSNIGRKDLDTTLYNCFVSSVQDLKIKDPDSIEGIYEMLRRQALTLKSEGGYGVNMSWIRPEGMYVAGIGSRTPGVLKFAELWDKSSEIITAGSVKLLGEKEPGEKTKIRKGAQMFVLEVWHPEILDFIVSKQTPGRLTKFNISVGITEGFMEAVEKDLDWDLYFPDTKCSQYKKNWDGNIERWKENDLPVIVYKTVKARKIWDSIMQSTYNRAEPGILFIDQTNKLNPLYYAENVRTTNPCFTKDNYLLTETGYVSFGELFNSQEDNKIHTDNRINFVGTKDDEKWEINPEKTGTTIRGASSVYKTQANAEVVKVNFVDGSSVKCTPDHHFATSLGMVEAKDLNDTHNVLYPTIKSQASVKGLEPKTKEEIASFLMGLVCGDGTFKQNESGGWAACLDFWGEESKEMQRTVCGYIDFLYHNYYKEIGKLDPRWENRKLSSYYISEDKENNKIRITSSWLAKFLDHNYGFNKDNKHETPRNVMRKSRASVGLYYVSALFYCDGSVQGDRVSGFSIRLAQSKEKLLQQVQLILSSNGIKSGVYLRRKAHEKEIKGKLSTIKAQYELIVSAVNFDYFADKMSISGKKGEYIDFIRSQNIKRNKKNEFIKIKSVESLLEREDVYCLQEEVTRSCIVNGKAARRCGEIPMSTGVCCLASMNLTQYVYVDGKKATFNYRKFEDDVHVAIRALDNVQDVSKTPLKEYKDSVLDKRRIGLGVTGLGSLHFMLGIPYGSKKSKELIKNIFGTKVSAELRASALLGKEKGSFRSFDKDKYFSSYWWKNLKIPQTIKDEIEAIGCMRNSHQSMNAPTGNTGIVANNISGGVEPSFTKEFFRWSIVPEKEQALLIEKGFKFPLVHRGEWKETEHMKFGTKGDEQILVGTFEGINYEVDKNRGLVKATLIRDYGWQWALDFYEEKSLKKMVDDGKFKDTTDLTVDEHVDVLAIIAHYTNQGNSKTINVPHDYPYDKFKDIYLKAYKSGIKGVTTYREGTMTAVLETSLKDNKDENKIVKTKAPKHEKVMDADLHHVTVNKQKYYVTVGMLDGEPYEVFTGINYNNDGEVYIPKKVSEGHITKEKRGKYVFVPDETDEKYDLTNGHSDPNADALTRVMSTSLRHGVDISILVHQLEKTEGPLVSFAKALSRTLKKYIKDGTEVHGAECGSCGSSKLVRAEGCIKCADCGWSKCG